MGKEIKKIAVSLMILVSAFLFSSCTSKQNTYGVIGAPAIRNDGKYAAVLIAESEGTTYQKNGGYRPTDYKNIYWLKLFETATGKLIKKKKLYEAKEPDNHTILCYGGFNDKIWLYGDGLWAYNISDLEVAANQRTLAAANNFDVNDFDDDPRYLAAVLDKGYINFMSYSKQKYRLNLTDLKITKRDAAEKETAKSINAMLHHDDAYGIRCDTFNNTVFALAKDVAQVMEYSPADTENKEVWYRMHFYNASYSIKQLGNHKSFTLFNVKQQGGSSYLNPCFLKNISTDNVIHLTQPTGYLIMHQDTTGSTAKAILTRADTNNNKIWKTLTGVSTKIGNCTVSSKYCIITTNTNYMLSPHIGKDALCIIEMETGKIIKLQLNL